MNIQTASREKLTALAKLQREQERCRRNAFSAMLLLHRADDSMLRNSGYASREAGIADTFIRAQKDIDRLMAEFVKQFPD